MKKAKSMGADCVDIALSESSEIFVNVRLTKLEKIVRADVANVGARVFVGKRAACATTDDVTELQSDEFWEKIISAAKNSPEESVKSRADASELCKNFKQIDMCDNDYQIDHEKLVEAATECENIALQTDGICNSEGACAKYTRAKIALMRDDGFFGEYEKTKHHVHVATLAEKNGDLQQDYAFSEAVYHADLKTPEQIAKEAAEKTIKKLGARKIQSCKIPVVFHRDVSRQLLCSMLGAVDGSMIARGMSFLKDKLSQKIFGNKISVIDQYAVDRGLRSRPFDSDGLECADNCIVENGILNLFLLNTKYANKLNMKSTRNASGLEGVSPNNVCIENGAESFDDLLKSIKRGLFVTDVLGNGLNIVTGNYSQGAVGFMIENGTITYPVNEITIASNFIDMFSNCSVASDLKRELGIDSPTLFMEEMVVGGI
jgi:PmbA protein